MSGYINFINSKIKKIQIELLEIESGFDCDLSSGDKLSLMIRYEKTAENLNVFLRKRRNYNAQKFEIRQLLLNNVIKKQQQSKGLSEIEFNAQQQQVPIKNNP